MSPCQDAFQLQLIILLKIIFYKTFYTKCLLARRHAAICFAFAPHIFENKNKIKNIFLFIFDFKKDIMTSKGAFPRAISEDKNAQDDINKIFLFILGKHENFQHGKTLLRKHFEIILS